MASQAVAWSPLCSFHFFGIWKAGPLKTRWLRSEANSRQSHRAAPAGGGESWQFMARGTSSTCKEFHTPNLRHTQGPATEPCSGSAPPASAIPTPPSCQHCVYEPGHLGRLHCLPYSGEPFGHCTLWITKIFLIVLVNVLIPIPRAITTIQGLT